MASSEGIGVTILRHAKVVEISPGDGWDWGWLENPIIFYAIAIVGLRLIFYWLVQ